MLDLSPEKIFVLAIVALVVLGPHRLPQAARTLGRFMGQLRALTSTVQDEVRDALHDPHEAFSTALSDFRPSEIRRNVRQTVMDTIAAPPSAPPARPTVDTAPAVPLAGSPLSGQPDDPSLN